MLCSLYAVVSNHAFFHTLIPKFQLQFPKKYLKWWMELLQICTASMIHRLLVQYFLSNFFTLSCAFSHHLHSRMCIRIYIFNFKKRNKQKQKQKKETNKLEKKKEYLWKIDQKKKKKNWPPQWVFFSSPTFRETRVFFLRYNYGLSLCFHSHYIEYKNFTQDILIPLLSLVS